MGRGKSDQKSGLTQLRPGLDVGEFSARGSGGGGVTQAPPLQRRESRALHRQHDLSSGLGDASKGVLRVCSRAVRDPSPGSAPTG